MEMTVFNKYVYDPEKDKLGKGNFATVFKAYDKYIKRYVALKFYQGDWTEEYDIIGEISKMKDLQHPNVIRYYDVNVLDRHTTYGDTVQTQVGILEFANSGSLADFFKSSPPDVEVREVFIGILKGLQYLHQNHIVHRDIKPGNILIHHENGKRIPKITDFGVSKILSSIHGTSLTGIAGTPEYMAPEQLDPNKFGISGKITPNVDLWAFGALVYRYCTGRLPYGLISDYQSHGDFMTTLISQPAPQDIYDLPQPYREIVEQCLVKQAKDRVQSVEPIIKLLQEGEINPVKTRHALSPDPTSVLDGGQAKPPTTQQLEKWLNKADGLFVAGKHRAAKEHYLKAQSYNPEDAYIQDRINSCNLYIEQEVEEPGEPTAIYDGLVNPFGEEDAPKGVQENPSRKSTKSSTGNSTPIPSGSSTDNKKKSRAWWIFPILILVGGLTVLGYLFNNQYQLDKVIQKGDAYYQQGQFAKALPIYEEALQMDENNSHVNRQIVQCQQKMKAASAADIVADLDQAIDDYEQEKYDAAFQTIYKYREEEDTLFTPTHQCLLGQMYEHGYGTSKDIREAIKWYQQSAEKGETECMFNLAILYDDGLTIAQDKKLAAQLYYDAAQEGHAPSQQRLGMMHLKGDGVEQNNGDALKWFQASARQEDPDGQYQLGLLHYNGKGVKQNYQEASNWFIKAAMQNHAAAQYYLGVMFNFGEGVSRDYQQAAEYYKKAIEKKYPAAFYRLGVLYLNGDGVPLNEEKAFSYFQQASSVGYVSAFTKLGEMYYDGRGVGQDFDKAAKLYEQAATQGDSEAQFRLAQLYDQGLGVDYDREEAQRWYKKAAQNGHKDAQYYVL